MDLIKQNEVDVNLVAGDVREKNYKLAMKMFFDELLALNLPEVKNVFDKWQIKEVDKGKTNMPQIAIEFPASVSRVQFFYNNIGEEYVEYIEGKIETKQG